MGMSEDQRGFHGIPGCFRGTLKRFGDLTAILGSPRGFHGIPGDARNVSKGFRWYQELKGALQEVAGAFQRVQWVSEGLQGSPPKSL